MAIPSQRVDWLFGRGLSIGCNLSWSVPLAWHALARDQQITRIKDALRAEMEQPGVDCSVIRRLLQVLARHTAPGWRHLFITTNWDFLLQREIQALGLTVLPSWLSNSHVYHLNGTVEELLNNAQRSPFLLEQDPSAQRIATHEANAAFGNMIWNRTFVVVGMSFECETDKFLLSALSRIQDDLPIGESRWVVINPDHAALTAFGARLRHVMPRADVKGLPMTLEEWLDAGLPELRSYGAVVF